MDIEMMPVRPLRPVAGYIGGKKQLGDLIAARIAEVDHRTYAEPFIGMGGVFLRRTARPPVEAINDVNRDVATLFRVLQRHYQAFLDMLRWQVASRSEYERLLKQDPDTLTDLERSARFLYLQRLAFGGKVTGRTFGIDPTAHPRLDVARIAPLLEAVHDRLANVWIECLSWDLFIERWDRPETLFYLDPPYWGTEHFSGKGAFARSDFVRLAEALKGIRGQFLLSLNDTSEVRALFAWAEIEELELSYTVSKEEAKTARELLISQVTVAPRGRLL